MRASRAGALTLTKPSRFARPSRSCSVTVLSAAIARLHAEEPGLRVVYLPDLMPELARAVVRSANKLRPQEVPFAILIDETVPEDLSDPECLVMAMGSSIQYRRYDRLAVVAGPHSV